MNLPHHRRHRAAITPRQFINRIERSIVRSYQFAANIRYYWIELAKATLP